MKPLLIIAILVAMSIIVYAFRGGKKHPVTLISDGEMSFHELSFVSIDGDNVQMDQYKGKYVLCVNVASKCGYTPQYEKLQQLQETYAEKLVIIGFPCNQFLFQEPGNSTEIKEFCTKNYGVTFPLSEKVDVKGSDQHPIYQWLTIQKLNGVSNDEVKWNFHKYLVSPEGKWIKGYGSKVDPLSTEITSLLK